MSLKYSGIPSEVAAGYWAGKPDANGMAPERHVSVDGTEPCRHCLGTIGRGEAYLTLAYRPFPALQPYAEVGPVFIHAAACAAYAGDGLPVRERRATGGRILRGYGYDDRIVYGTGVVVANAEIEEKAAAILARDDIAYVHMRSAANNCFTLRVDREVGSYSI
jgi:hypothetical protein